MEEVVLSAEATLVETSVVVVPSAAAMAVDVPSVAVIPGAEVEDVPSEAMAAAEAVAPSVVAVVVAVTDTTLYNEQYPYS